MKPSNFFVALAIVGFLAGCASPQDKAANAEADMTKKRMMLADEYQECTGKANAYEQAVAAGTGNDMASADQIPMSQCEEIMKTLEALK